MKEYRILGEGRFKNMEGKRNLNEIIKGAQGFRFRSTLQSAFGFDNDFVCLFKII